ncbi:hypothetical protein MASR2M8_21740 [Opitutaceae bacterium]
MAGAGGGKWVVAAEEAGGRAHGGEAAKVTGEVRTRGWWFGNPWQKALEHAFNQTIDGGSQLAVARRVKLQTSTVEDAWSAVRPLKSEV